MSAVVISAVVKRVARRKFQNVYKRGYITFKCLENLLVSVKNRVLTTDYICKYLPCKVPSTQDQQP